MQTGTDTKSNGTAKPSRRLAATVATVVAAAALAGAGVAAAQSEQAHSSAVGGCMKWYCGDNHNEVMATTATR